MHKLLYPTWESEGGGKQCKQINSPETNICVTILTEVNYVHLVFQTRTLSTNTHTHTKFMRFGKSELGIFLDAFKTSVTESYSICFTACIFKWFPFGQILGIFLPSYSHKIGRCKIWRGIPKLYMLSLSEHFGNRNR